MEGSWGDWRTAVLMHDIGEWLIAPGDGEVRQEESLDLFIALNSGLPGMCSVHANSARR